MAPPSKQRSRDDLAAASAQEAAEARAKAAVRLLNEAEERVSLTGHLLEAEQAKVAELERRLMSSTHRGSSSPPDSLTLKGKGWKVAVPFTLLVSLAPLGWAGVSSYLDLQRQLKVQADSFASYEKRFEQLDRKLSEQGASLHLLQTDLAQLRGYLEALPVPKAKR